MNITFPNHVKSRKEHSPETPGVFISLMLLLVAYGPVLAFTPERAVIQDLMTRDDGEVQSVAVVNSSYLLARNGNPEALQVRALNAAQEVIFSFDMAEPAPGKQEP